MCNFGSCNGCNNNWWWIIILFLLGNNCGCDCDSSRSGGMNCGCNNNWWWIIILFLLGNNCGCGDCGCSMPEPPSCGRGC